MFARQMIKFSPTGAKSLAPEPRQVWVVPFRRPVLKHLTRVLVRASLIMTFAASLVWSGFSRGLPEQEGILNFGKVNERLYRGAQPDTEGMKSLKRLGVKLIVNLRMADDSW